MRPSGRRSGEEPARPLVSKGRENFRARGSTRGQGFRGSEVQRGLGTAQVPGCPTWFGLMPLKEELGVGACRVGLLAYNSQDVGRPPPTG